MILGTIDAVIDFLACFEGRNRNPSNPLMQTEARILRSPTIEEQDQWT
jgi:hypothetical protein